MSVSLEEQRFSRVHGEGEPDFIELPAPRPPAHIPERFRAATRARPENRSETVARNPATTSSFGIRVDSRHQATLRAYSRREPGWKRVLAGLLAFERNTGYAISIFAHLCLIIILALFVVGGSGPTPRIVIDSSFADEPPGVGELLETEVTLSEASAPPLPVVGDIAADEGNGLGRFFGEDGAEFFGLRAGGRDFVYIVDCSGSMQGAPFERARQELLDSINELKPDQRMYVMFYADAPYLMFNESGPPTGLIPATALNKDRVREWTERIDADGGTEPEQALKWALGLDPDAVFLLTDGRFGDIVDNITSANHGAARIHTIAFINSEAEELLRRMSDENGGTYRFVP